MILESMCHMAMLMLPQHLPACEKVCTQEAWSTCSENHPTQLFLLCAGRLLSRTYQVPSHPQSYDAQLACKLWDVSADFCQLSPADKKQT